MESFGTAARRLLAGLEREAARKAKETSSERSTKVSEEFDAEASQEGALKPRRSNAGEERRDGLERDASGVVGFDSRIKGDEMRPPATNADSYLKEFTAVTEGRIIDARWIFEARLSGSPRPLDAQAGQVVPFPAWAVRRVEWAW